MTTNQLAYWSLEETKRANKAKEDENYRSNVARETETNRSNVAKELETNRANKASEGIKRMDTIWSNVNNSLKYVLPTADGAMKAATSLVGLLV